MHVISNHAWHWHQIDGLFLAEGKKKKRGTMDLVLSHNRSSLLKVAAKGRTKKLRLNMHACLQLKLHHRPAAANLAIVDTAPKEITVHLLEK